MRIATYHKIVKQTVHILCSGRVQGVSFRAFTQKIALKEALCGWVRNLDDGRVEAVLQGQRDRIKSAVDHLKVGPPRAIVEAVQCEELKIQMSFEGFVIKEDGESPWSDSSK